MHNDDKPRIYLAHPMRGKLGSGGDNAHNYQNKNSDIAIRNVRWLRERFPEVYWYCPGEVEIPVQTLFRLGFVSTEQILQMDLVVLEERCYGGLIHRWEPSIGATGEMGRCIELGYPYLLFEDSSDISDCPIGNIQVLIEKVVELHYN